MATSMDELASNLLAILHKPSVPSETKLAQLNSLKSSIKHQRIPESAQHNTTECVRLAIASQTSPSLVAAGFSSLSHLVKRLALQEQMSILFSHRIGLIPTLLERLGDSKETHRTAATQAFCDIWPGKQFEVEKAIREGPLVNGNVRAKLAAMQWVTRMHEEQNLQFRSFVPPIVVCLEDADGTVRESAKLNLVELFRGARDGAKADLKKQLLVHDVRKSIANYILSQLGLPSQSEQPVAASSASQPSTSLHRSETPLGDASLADSSTTTEPSLPPSAEVAQIEPLYIYTSRELEDVFRQMQPSFEDKEKEDNWKARDNNVLKLRRLLKGNAPYEHLSLFLGGIKSLLDGILKVVHSLRTTLSTNGCQLLQELARTLGPAIDPMAEIILHGLEKMCSSTKHIAAQNGNTTTDTLLSHVSYNIRLLQHVWAAANDKNVQPRIFACGWLQTMLKKASHIKSHFDHSGGLEVADKCIRKGLSDANPKVRESMRGTYWVFAQIWPDKASAIMSTLDPKSQQLLEKDPSNPNAPKGRTDFTRSVGPDAGSNPRLAASTSRASLKEQIAAQKKATLAAKRVPDRPNSAMSSFSPIKEVPTPARRVVPPISSTSRGPATSSTLSSSRQPSASSNAPKTVAQGSLMSAPIWRPRKPDVPRPATADPYANAKLRRDETPPTSPRAPTVASHAKSKSTSATGAFSTQSSRGSSPRTSPMKQKTNSSHPAERDLSRPNISNRHALSPSSRDQPSATAGLNNRPIQRDFKTTQPESDRPQSSDSLLTETIDEDNFTLVIPAKSQIYRSEPTATVNTQGRNTIAERSDDRQDDPVVVFEDPIDQPKSEIGLDQSRKLVLEEVHPNEQNLPASQPDPIPSIYPIAVTEYQERPISPKKVAETPPAYDSSAPGLQDRNELLKMRKLMSSGTERIRARTLDAHGFRRIQELIKNNNQTPNPTVVVLLEALLSYIKEPAASLKTSIAKANALKSQALSTARAILALNRNNYEIQELVPSALVTFIEATAVCESSTSHSFMEFEKAVGEVVKSTEADADLIQKCVDRVAMLAEADSEPSIRASQPDYQQLRAAHARKISTILVALSSLAALTFVSPQVTESTEYNLESTKATRQRLARLAVKFLRSTDPDVRRHAMEFTVVVYSCFPVDAATRQEVPTNSSSTANGKEEFWKFLRMAGEQQCNLVAYYIAKKERS